ncbi:ATP-grasp domain-containing protein [Arcanobacterium canis]|uniref:ATP-grasp domain-containing protein n=1 Tax=Arcanobacterium canis TaxID=999183 RepID=A0ABY8FZH9_9ACTO|nr:ATP-grasp domain-containing protein [Arcanobacterium canis]WFM83933.1 ATP-grasp domain-containing protein [Arcanobacterium canis]
MIDNVLPVIFGYDISAYSFARLFHEFGGYRSLVVADADRGPIQHSRLFDVRRVPRQVRQNEDLFYAELAKIEEEYPDSTLLLLVNTDDEVEFVSHHRGRLERWIAPYSSEEVIERASNKDSMAELITNLGLAVPARIDIAITPQLGTDVATNMQHSQADVAPASADRLRERWAQHLHTLQFPVIAKPQDARFSLDRWWNQGLRKVKVLPTVAEALCWFDELVRNGVNTKLIVQELIPGHDTAQWLVNGYVNSAGEISAIGSGHVLLGLHQPAYIGNAGIVLLEKNDELIAQAAQIVKAAGIRGFFSMDVKVDPRDGTAYWLDLNPRIGRGHYYLKVGGVDLAKALIDDVEGRPMQFQTNSATGIFSIIPQVIATRKYVPDAELWKKVKDARKVAKVDPLAYSKDRHLKRWIYRTLHGINEARRMRQFYPEPTYTGF